jgi:predicted nucleotidyltransferase
MAATRLPEDFPRRQLIEELARRFARHPAVERVWLFGSRARGDHFERSDIDLAIEAPGMSRDDWVRLHVDFEDEASTLLGIDLVRLDEASQDLIEDIEREGIPIHERARPGQAAGRSRPVAGPAGGGARDRRG